MAQQNFLSAFAFESLRYGQSAWLPKAQRSITKAGAHVLRGTLAEFLEVRLSTLPGGNETRNETAKHFA